MDPGQWSTSAAELQSRRRSQSASTTFVATCIDISPWTFRLACPLRPGVLLEKSYIESAPVCQIWPWSIKGGLVHEPPPKKIKSKFTVFRLPSATACLPNLTRISYGGAVTGAEITICYSADQHCRWLSNRQFSCFLFQELQRPLPSR